MTESNMTPIGFEPLLTPGAMNGTCLQGYVTATYYELCEVFGEPHFLDGDKTTVEWGLIFTDGTLATVYDYKEDATPDGRYEWHIGGRKKQAADLVNEAVKAYREEIGA